MNSRKKVIFSVLVFGSAFIIYGIIKLDDNGFAFIIVGGICAVLSIINAFFENIFVNITIDGNNKLLLIKRTRICYCLKNSESYNLDDIEKLFK